MAEPHSTVTGPEVRLRPGINLQFCAAVFAKHGRVHIPQVFPDDVAIRIERALREETPWSRVFNHGDKHHDLGPGIWQSIPEDKRTEVAAAVLANGRTRFAYFLRELPDRRPARGGAASRGVRDS